MGLLFAILNLCIFALICVVVILLIEWVVKKIADVPQEVLMIIRAIVALIFIGYLLAVLVGGTQYAPLPNFFGQH